MYVTDGELKDAGIEDATHRENILSQLSRQRERLDPHSGDTPLTHAPKSSTIGSGSNLMIIHWQTFLLLIPL